MLDVGNDEFVGNILYVAGTRNSAKKMENACMNKDSHIMSFLTLSTDQKYKIQKILSWQGSNLRPNG